jgi:hypothetical protein
MPGSPGANAMRVRIFILLAILAVHAQWKPARAAGTVGTGSAASCTEAALDAALAGGGLVTFHCGPGFVRILITTMKVITVNTTLDGGTSNVTLDGGHRVRLFHVNKVQFDVSRLSLTNGGTWPKDFPRSPVGLLNGGAIENLGGTVNLTTVRLIGNIGGDGGAIYNTGTLHITDGLFFLNWAINGASIFNKGTMRVLESQFIFNRAQRGGGVMNDGGTLELLQNNLFRTNMAERGGGGIYNRAGNVTVRYGKFIDNRADIGRGIVEGGGGIYTEDDQTPGRFPWRYGRLRVFTTSFVSNRAEHGGGMASRGAWTDVSHSLFGGNIAGAGGGFFSSAPREYTSTRAWISNSTFDGNRATVGGAMHIRDGFDVLLSYVTITNNSARNRDGVAGGGGIVGQPLIEYSIVASNDGDNCGTPLRDRTGRERYTTNLEYPGDTCHLLITGLDPLLAALADNGGPTQTRALLPGSPAIDRAGPPSIVFRSFLPPESLIVSTDQRFEPRSLDGDRDGSAVSDLGAFEYKPIGVAEEPLTKPTSPAPTFEPPK